MNELNAAAAELIGRETAPALDARLGEKIGVLDHGFIRVVDYMGSDASIVQAARVSYGRGTKTVNEDRGLIRYQMRHRHSTPFEMCEIKLHVKLPMFVARQWIRHSTANVNEVSARYSILDSEFYLPPADALAAQATSNNKGRGAALDADEAERAHALLKTSGESAYARYLDLMNIRAYADVILDLISDWVPLTYKAFIDYRRDDVNFSGPAMRALRRRLAREAVTQEDSGLSAREWWELEAALAIDR
mgnify:CR=1 FL=1